MISRALSRGRGSFLLHQLGEPSLRRAFGTTCNAACWVTWKISELDDQACKSGADPARLAGPFDHLAEKGIEHRLRFRRHSFGDHTQPLAVELAVTVKRCGQKIVLAAEMAVERALGQASARSDFIHGNSGEASAVKKIIRSFDDPLLCQLAAAPHRCRPPPAEYTD
jgi:hypothetical protein